MEFFTKIDIAPFTQKIDLNSRIMLIGSCFSTSIGQMLRSYGFNAQVNPFGVLFNPASIAYACERLARPQAFEASDVIDISQNHTQAGLQSIKDEGSAGRFCSFSHHSSFARSSVQEFLGNANSELERAAEFFKQADTLIVTLGTAYVFRHIAKKMIVSNCHKIVPQEFSRELLTIEQSLECLERIMQAARGKHIIFTVSPVRHLADGAHGNQLSKSTLLHAINELNNHTAQARADQATGKSRIQEGENDIDYFPAFEIMMDELRDYRFYAEDMVHPSEVAVKYIFERFTEVAIEEPCKPQMIAAHKKWLFQQHNSSR